MAGPRRSRVFATAAPARRATASPRRATAVAKDRRFDPSIHTVQGSRTEFTRSGFLLFAASETPVLCPPADQVNLGKPRRPCPVHHLGELRPLVLGASLVMVPNTCGPIPTVGGGIGAVFGTPPTGGRGKMNIRATAVVAAIAITLLLPTLTAHAWVPVEACCLIPCAICYKPLLAGRSAPGTLLPTWEHQRPLKLSPAQPALWEFQNRRRCG